MNAAEYKIYHESFMQNNHGSTAFHTFLCIFFTVQCSLLSTIKRKRNTWTQYVYEYVIIVLPMILAHTLLADYIAILNVIVLILLLTEVTKNHPLLEIQQCFNSETNLVNKRIISISILRALTYLITALCILAVDFKDFPRYLAKTENYGYSLMDTGVGLFVLMSGLVHKEIHKNNYVSVLKSNTKFVVILLVLGVARFVSIKQLDYQEHVTEYGVHWNFFFTLALCKLLSFILLLVCKSTLQLTVSVVIMHEFFLYAGLQNWVFSDISRTNLLNANREGISSSLGYVFLYLFAVHLKNEIAESRQTYIVIKKLLIYTMLLVSCSYVSNVYRPASRTLANTAYCCYLALLLVFILCIMYVLEVLYVHNKKLTFEIPLILQAVNNNGLLYFLVSNLSVGLINMMFRTFFLTSFVTFIILNLYMVFNLAVILYLNKINVKL